MYREKPASEEAKSLLFSASRRLNTEDPVQHLGDVMDSSMRRPAEDPIYARSKMVEPGFSETSQNLAFLMDAGGPDASPNERLETSVNTMRKLVNGSFGREALHWLDERIEPVRGRSNRATHFGAWFGSGFDHDGIMESLISYEWNPVLTDALPNALYQLSTRAMQLLPGLRPIFSTVRCGRSAGSQQMSFSLDAPTPLVALKPLMDEVGLGHQHAGLASACAFVLGAMFTLPAGTAILTLQPTHHGAEMRLDVDLDALRDTPSQFMSLLKMQMAERPKSLNALNRWLMALTPEGYSETGHVSVLSVRVRKEMPARLSLHLRPAMFRVEPTSHAPVAKPGS